MRFGVVPKTSPSFGTKSFGSNEEFRRLYCDSNPSNSERQNPGALIPIAAGIGTKSSANVFRQI